MRPQRVGSRRDPPATREVLLTSGGLRMNDWEERFTRYCEVILTCCRKLGTDTKREARQGAGLSLLDPINRLSH